MLYNRNNECGISFLSDHKYVLMTTLHFLAQFEYNMENVAQVKNTTEKTGQDVTQIKYEFAKMKG